jgi:hypothetical protein
LQQTTQGTKRETNCKIIEVEPSFLHDEVRKRLQLLYIAKKELISANELEAESRLLVFDILKYHGFLSIERYFEYLNKGIRGHYGDFNKISIVQCHSWVKRGLEEEKQGFKINSLTGVEERKQIEMISEREKQVIIENQVRLKFEEYCKSGFVEDEFKVCYKYFVRNGRIKPESYKRYLDLATEAVRKYFYNIFPMKSTAENAFKSSQGEIAVISKAELFCLNDFFENNKNKLNINK